MVNGWKQVTKTMQEIRRPTGYRMLQSRKPIQQSKRPKGYRISNTTYYQHTNKINKLKITVIPRSPEFKSYGIVHTRRGLDYSRKVYEGTSTGAKEYIARYMKNNPKVKK